ncbi:MAG: molybdopterin-dependent oxidoreductase [Steroidobacteraceae bacterium]
MPTLHVDGRDYEARPTDNLLHACLSLGLDLPYFCWHPALGSVGACRQCAVKQFRDDKDAQGKLVMACMTAAADGTRISIADPEARAFRASVIEWLMTNHPHDCPVCEEGGECHLQDMTVLTGHAYRRYRFKKRTYRNQYLGPFLTHEMNRCIACYRCVRFYRDYAGGRDFDVQAIHNHVYFGRHSDGVLQSEFSGNLAEICPTGVFDDKPFSALFTRKWDLSGAPSVCMHCGLGCNTLTNARQGRLRRVLNRYHEDVNGYFLCDRGRYGHGFVSGPERIDVPLAAFVEGAAGPASSGSGTDDGSAGASGSAAAKASAASGGVAAAVRMAPREALERAAAFLREGAVIGIGSPRASLESNFALRELVGADHFHIGICDRERRLLAAILDALRAGPAPAATLREAEHADAVLILGEDVPETAPRLALALRQMVRRAGFERAERLKVPLWQDAAVREAGGGARSPLFIATADATRLDELATRTFRAAPDDIVRLGFAVAHAVDPGTPAVSDLDDRTREAARQVAERLLAARSSVVVAGTSLGSEAAIRAAAAIAWALQRRGADARLLYVMPECNSLGAALLGGAALSEALEALRQGRARTAVILENDLYRRVDGRVVERALSAARHVIAIDHTVNETVRHAHLVLPAATFAEASGTVVSHEGRAQRFFQVLYPDDSLPGQPAHEQTSPSWRWLGELAGAAGAADAASAIAAADPPGAANAASGRDARAGRDRRWNTLDDVIAALGRAYPELARIREAAPPADFLVHGERVSSAPLRESGRTAVHANRTVFEPPPPRATDAPFTGSMEGYYGALPGALYPYYWAPSWNSVQSLNKFQQEVAGALRGGNPGVRLIAPARPTEPTGCAGASDATSAIPAAFARREREGLWLVVPQYRVFGSEELSALAPAVAELITPATLALNPDDAAALGASGGEELELPLDAQAQAPLQRAFARVHSQLPRGVAALSVGLPGMPAFDLPAWLPIRRATANPPPETGA